MLFMLATKKRTKGNERQKIDMWYSCFSWQCYRKINYSLDKKNNNNKEGYTFSMWEIHIYII